MPTDCPICSPKPLAPDLAMRAARYAALINPANALSVGRAMSVGFDPLSPLRAALLTSAYWGAQGVHLTIGFLESVPSDFAKHVVDHANAWGSYGNVVFSMASDVHSAQVRVTVRGSGYWSYLGTGILAVPAGEPTLCIQDFDRGMPESEWKRVVRHEIGHTLGMPHEHMRAEIVAMLDESKTIAYFGRTQGWPPNMVREQVLTPLDPSTIRGTPTADVTSIMTYQIPGECTKSGRPIPGGSDIDQVDGAFVASIYPKGSGGGSPEPMTAKEIYARIQGAF